MRVASRPFFISFHIFHHSCYFRHCTACVRLCRRPIRIPRLFSKSWSPWTWTIRIRKTSNSHRKTGALVALVILPYYFMPWEQVSDTFRSHFSAKPAGVSGIIQSQSHDMSQHEGIPVSNLLANFLSLRKPSNVTQKSQLRSRRLQGLCDGLCDVIKNIQRWIRMHSRLLC